MVNGLLFYQFVFFPLREESCFFPSMLFSLPSNPASRTNRPCILFHTFTGNFISGKKRHCCNTPSPPKNPDEGDRLSLKTILVSEDNLKRCWRQMISNFRMQTFRLVLTTGVELYRAASLGPTVKKSPSDAKCQDIIKLLMLFRLTAQPENLISLSLPSKS